MGKKWSVCGNGNCARRKDHSGPHSWEMGGTSDESEMRTIHNSRPLTGQIGAIQAKIPEDPEYWTLVKAAYLRNDPRHREAQKRIAQLDLERAKQNLGLI